ncbi:S41 family peptidase [Mariniplasma anaerobium]|uniref:Peptidase S41 n=1 Tax=Mariniplasma anaerobium TaxID=2735436 RepID=A0A7U9TGZ5_9MOLU|nr:S41 family peptidase [Mariniplasma anaerobium]BCR36333.1 peptidase S41 [Mariniplasma anaerobium]
MENRKIGILFFASVLLAFFAGYQVQTFLVTNEPEPFLDVYAEITEALDRYYYYDLEQGEKDAAFVAQMEAIVNSYAEQNNDPYTRLSAAALNVAPTGDESYVGLGITITTQDNGLRVEDVLFQGPSFTKLYPNDLIIGVMDQTTAIYFEDLDDSTLWTSYLAGEVDEVKSLIVLQPNLNEVTIDITYEEILTPTAYAKSIDADIAYIKITEFSGYIQDVTEGTAKVFSDVLNSLEDDILVDETDTLILDLRNNPGGSLTALHNQGSQGLIPGITQQLLIRNVETPLFSMINKINLQEDYLGGLSVAKPYDIKVLVNEHSASAAEVLAAALSVNGGYELYGNYTYGKDVYQNTVLLETINTIRYYLTYTEGNWLYDGDKKVSEYPLDVNLIEQTGYLGLSNLYFDGDLSIDDVSAYLVRFQEFLNVYFELDGISMIRTDGYFDQTTEDYILLFQQEQSLLQTSILDMQTANHMFNLLKTYQQDLTYDNQVEQVIDLIRS